MEFIQVTTQHGIAAITLNRPEKSNALHGPLIHEVLQTLKKLAAHEETKVLILHGNGDHFCSGGDIAWMQSVAADIDSRNYTDAQLLADLLFQLYSFPKPTIVLAHGATLGGGLGLLAAADIGIGAKGSVFGFTEVKIGITPSMISPYIISAIGARMASYYFLSGERFDVEEAKRIHLIHEITKNENLLESGFDFAKKLLQNSPFAMRAAKQLIRGVSKTPISEKLAQQTAEHLAEIRATNEAQEGLKAFLEKRKPKWIENISS